MDFEDLKERIYNLETEVSVLLGMLKNQKEYNESSIMVNDTLKQAALDLTSSIAELHKDIADLQDSVVNFVNFMEMQNEINASNQRMFNHITSYINEN